MLGGSELIPKDLEDMRKYLLMEDQGYIFNEEHELSPHELRKFD